MSADLARAGAAFGAAGLALVIAAPPRWPRLAGLFTWAAGGALVVPYLAPSDRAQLLVAGALAGVALAVALAAVFLRWPWTAPMAALACAPIRIPLDLDGEQANLLVPLYAVVAGAALALGWQLLKGDVRARELGPVSLPLAGFVVWAGSSVLWTDDLREGAIDVLAFYLPFGLLAVVVARLPWSRRWLTALYVQLAGMALAFAGIGIFQWLTRDVFWNPKVIVGNAYAPFYRVNSVFWDPSIYGRFLVLAILASLVLALFAAERRVLALACVVVAATWLGLVFSFSQSSFVALMIVVLAAAAFAWGRKAVVGLALVAGVLVSVGFSAPAVRNALLDDTETALDRATSGRTDLIANGVRIAADHPVAGVGQGSFKRAYAERTGLRGEEPKRAASHNTPVTVAAETGVPGLLLFAWTLLAALAVPLRRVSRSFAGRASLTAGLSVLAIAVHSLFYNAFFEDPMAWGAIGLAALVGAWRGSERT